MPIHFPFACAWSQRHQHPAGIRVCVQWAITAILVVAANIPRASAAQLHAGAAKVDITSEEAGAVDGRLHARALVLSDGTVKTAIVTLDVVSIGEIGYISDEFLETVRSQIETDLGIPPQHVFINASHCHGIPCKDVAERTIQAVRDAASEMVPVTIGSGIGHEDRIMENRRLKLKSGKVIDVRHAYSMPSDEDVAEVGPVDPEIGILRLDRDDGTPLAIVYNFACHPIQGVPSKANTADITGFASEVIEDNLGDGTVALFVQGCGGDINPVYYKDVDHPRSAEPLGNMLALSTLKATRGIETHDDQRLRILSTTLDLPRQDLADRIASMEDEQLALMRALRGTSLSLKTFLPLAVKYNLSKEFPSYYSHRYLHDEKLGRDDLQKLDEENRRNMAAYVQNILTMEQLTRTNTNLALLKMHHAQNVAAGSRIITVEVAALRIGDFVLTTFPGELTVPIGLNIKKASPHDQTFVAGYTNGYIYYCPTAEQLLNRGNAQEDSDCILAPEWQEIYETKVAELLRQL